MEARNKSVESWFTIISEGLLTLPRFQRYEAWKPNQIGDVLENMVREPSLPIGALLILEVGDEELFRSRPIASAPQPASKPKYNLLDGQQRITAIWRSLKGSYDDYSILVSVEDMDRPTIKIVKRTMNTKTQVKQPAWVDDPAKCYEYKDKQLDKTQFVPVTTLLPTNEGEQLMYDWISKAIPDDASAREQLTRKVFTLRKRIAVYQIPFLSLPSSVGRDTALDIFIKMNVSATPLKDFDIVVAQLEDSTEKSLHDMITDLQDRVPAVKDYGTVEDIALAVGALLNGKPPLKKTYLEKTFGNELDAVWEDVVKGIDGGTKFLRDEKIFNDKLVPVEGIIYLVSALWAGLPLDGTDKEGFARKLIRKVIWRASFTDRYLKTSTTTAFADFKALRNRLLNPHSEEEPALFDTDMYDLPTPDELIRGGWPKRRDRLGRAILVLSLQDGGRDFASNEDANSINFQKREYHHIFPRSLIENDFPESVNSALNCALISWKTNRKISAKSPAEYIEERASFAGISLDEVKDRLKSHLIPCDQLLAGDYQEFLDARAHLVHDRMAKLASGND